MKANILKNRTRFISKALVGGLLSVVALSVAADNSVVTPGAWSDNWRNCVAYADAHNLPMVMIWGNQGCSYCATLTNAVQTVTFSDWVKTNGESMVLCMVEGGNTNGNYGVDVGDNALSYKSFNNAKSFAKTAAGTSDGSNMRTGYPYVCLYQPYDDGNSWEATSFVGRQSVLGSDGTLSSLALCMIARINSFLANRQPPSCQAGFPMGMTENDRLEAIPGQTDHVWVPVRRSDEPTFEASSTLTLDLGAQTVTSNLVWEVGVTNLFVRFELPTTGQAVGKVLPLALRTASGHLLATSAVTFVETPENNPKNPCFIGEKTAGELGWGEWTMDLDVATQKVAAVAGSATLVLVGGSLWCPDCYSTDHYLIETDGFRNWASENKIACVAIDVVNPHSETANTSLLTWDTARVGDRYVTCNYGQPTNELLRYESGAGYLSRHGVSPAAAAAVAARNKWLLNTSTEVGGLCRPEDVATDNERTGPFKTGIPCLIALRPDGTIAGRIYQFNNTSAQSDKDLAAHIQRLREMFGQQSMTEEEDNDHWQTTCEVLNSTSAPSVSSTLSAVDGNDVYRLTDSPYTRTVLTLRGDVPASVLLKVSDEAGTATKELGVRAGVLADGLCLTTRLTSAACHVKVTFPKDGDGYATEGPFAFTNTTSTVCAYTLSLTGKMSGGEIGFVHPAAEVSESAAAVEIPVVREMGNGGSASVRVVLVPDAATTEALSTGRISWSEQTLSWEDGEQGVKNAVLTVADDADPLDDLALVFRLESLEGSSDDLALADGAETYALTVTDDDGSAILLRKGVTAEVTQPIEGWQEGDTVVFAKVSGSLASGLSVAFDEGVLKVSGTPKRTANTLVVYRVKIFRSGSCVSTQDVTFELSVRATDFAAVVPALAETLTYRNLPMTEIACSSCGSEVRRIKGLLTLTVPSNGRASAKVRTTDGSRAYAADGWCSYGRTTGVGAVLANVDDPSDTLRLLLTADSLTISSATYTNSLPLVGWSGENPATAWRGQYTIQMPQTDVQDTAATARMTGDAYMALRMVSETAVTNGCMLYAGVLPNGRGFYGSSVLLDHRDGTASLPFLAIGSLLESRFWAGGELEVAASASETLWGVRAADVVSSWCVSNSVYAHTADFLIYGGYYDWASVEQLFIDNYGSKTAAFGFEAGAEARVALQMTATGPALASRAENASEVELSFSPVTGVVSGNFQKDGIGGVLFRGIALPGWQACSDCSGEEFVERPWATGSAFYDDLNATCSRDGIGISLDCE